MQFKPIAAIIVLLLIVASLIVSGCTTSDNSKSRNVDVKVISANAPATTGTPKQGFTLVTYNATVTNVNAPSRHVNASFFSLRDSYNNSYNVSKATNNISVGGFPNNVVTNPGDKVSGLLLFEIPQNATPANVVYNDSELIKTIDAPAIETTVSVKATFLGSSNSLQSSSGTATHQQQETSL
jgi:Domain of unknown function (DUF4352)